MLEELLKKLWDYSEKRWYRPSTIIILVVVLALFLLWFVADISFESISIEKLLIVIGVLVLLVVFWFVSTRIPTAPKGTIGFALGVVADTPEQQQKLKKDFSDTLRNFLNRSRYKYRFAFLELPNHFVEKISSHEDARKILHATRCSFMIYGKVRTVTLNGQLQQILILEGIVAHKPVSREVNEKFSREFADLFPRRVAISQEGDLFQFEITANLVEIVSKYIIGIAALLSADVGYAQELFENLSQDLNLKKINYPGIVKINQRLPSRLEDVYVVQLNIIYHEWLRTRDIGLIHKMYPFLEKLKSLSPNNFDARFFRTFWYFLTTRDIKKAKAEILKAKKRKHTTWRYNYAFLLAYEGNIQEAEKQYELAVKEIIEEPRVILDIVEFIMWVLNTEPEKTQLYYCLGIIYYYAICDYALALENLERFVDSTPQNRFPLQRKEAQRLILKIQKDVKTGRLIFEV